MSEREKISQELYKLNQAVDKDIKVVDKLILDLKKIGLSDKNRV